MKKKKNKPKVKNKVKIIVELDSDFLKEMDFICREFDISRGEVIERCIMKL